MPIMNEKGEYLTCPKCGTIFIDYDHHQKRFRCLIWDCGWIEQKESNSKDYSCLIAAKEKEKEISD